MRKRTILPLCISSILGGIILILSIIGLCIDKTKNYYSFFMLMLSGVIIIASGIMSYFVHDRMSAIINTVGILLGLIAIRTLYVSPTENSIIPRWMIIIMLLSMILNFSSIILSIYRLPINQTVFDNKLLGNVKENQTSTLVIGVVNIILLSIITMGLILNEHKMPITIVCCIITMLVIISGKVLTYLFKNRIGSLMILTAPIIIILGSNPKEFSLENTSILLMLLEYVFVISLAVSEFAKVENGEEAKIGPKEYKQ